MPRALSWALCIPSLQSSKHCWKVDIINSIVQIWKLRLREVTKFAKCQIQNSNFVDFHKDCLFMPTSLKASSLKHRRGLINVICFFQVSDNMLSFPGKSLKVMQ